MYYLILYFFVYGFLGWCTEVAFAACKERKFVNRGFLNGPICPIYGIGVGIVVQFLTPYKENLVLLYIASVVMVTALEWVTGFILEKIFHNKWWDYSKMPLNLNGYVCLLFSLIWGAACVLIVDFIHPLIHKVLSWIPFPVGMTLIVVLGIVMFADLYVTASTILKMNKHLEKMKEIIADQLSVDADSITETTSFKDDLGADSLDLFELVMALEDEYSVEIPSEDLQNLLTVGDVMNYLKGKGVEA